MQFEISDETEEHETTTAVSPGSSCCVETAGDCRIGPP